MADEREKSGSSDRFGDGAFAFGAWDTPFSAKEVDLVGLNYSAAEERLPFG